MAWVVLGVGAVLGGCGREGAIDDRPRQAVAGTVTLDGKPLPRGTIQFQPTSMKEGVVAGALIADGKYAISRDHGLVPGEYSVSISSVPPYEPPPGPPGPSTNPPAPGGAELVPAKYNTQSTLTAKVEAGQTKPIDFALQK